MKHGGALRRRWHDFWFRPVSPLGIRIARLLVSFNALWIVLSRPDWPDLFDWPRELWAGAGTSRLRFLYVAPASVERVLYWVLVIALIAVIFNLWTRFFACLAGLLLYHFAPLEHVIAERVGPYFGGLTLPLLALLIISFSYKPRRNAPPSFEYRWPLALIQLLFAFTYFLAALSKLRYSGLGWISADNFRSTVEVFNTFEPGSRPLAHFLVEHPTICLLIAAFTVLLELAFPLVLVSRRAMAILVPLAVIGHIGIYLVLGVVFLNVPLLLLFVDWDLVAERLRRVRTATVSG